VAEGQGISAPKAVIPCLTSLRFFAAALIVINHSRQLLPHGHISKAFVLTQGVSFFFVLSGFILSYTYPRLAGGGETMEFFRARFARLWPCHAATAMLALALGGWAIFAQFSWQKATAILAANLLMLHGLIPLPDFYFSLNSVSWTISTEFFFYLMFPILLVAAQRSIAVPLAVSALIAALGVGLYAYGAPRGLTTLSVDEAIYFNPLVRLFEFVLGMAACSLFWRLRGVVFWKPHFGTALEAAVLVLVLFVMVGTRWIRTWSGLHIEAVIYYIQGSGAGPVFALMMAIFALQRGWISALLGSPALVALGSISYALYLTHPFIVRCFSDNSGTGWFNTDPAWLAYLVLWTGCAAIASILYVFLERPAQALLRGRTDRLFSLLHSSAPARIMVTVLPLAFLALSALLWRVGTPAALPLHISHISFGEGGFVRGILDYPSPIDVAPGTGGAPTTFLFDCETSCSSIAVSAALAPRSGPASGGIILSIERENGSMLFSRKIDETHPLEEMPLGSLADRKLVFRVAGEGSGRGVSLIMRMSRKPSS
jgi:peptidoglycan/LPS O-acetylase OafA/YrhL